MVSRTFKYIGVAIVIVVVMVASLLLTAPYLVSTDSIRIRLAQDLSAWTGYNVQLREPPHLSFFPSFEASLTGVVLNRPQSGAPLMEAQRIDVDLSLFEAILGHVVFSETRIIQPHFIIEEPLKTTADFLATLSQSQGTFGNTLRNAIDLVKENPHNPDITRTLAQPFGRIIIQDGRISYRLGEDQPEEDISDVNATLDWQVSNRSAALNGSGLWHGQMTTVQFSASQPLLLLAGATSETRLSINSKSGGMTLSGQAQIAKQFIFDGHLAARSPGWNQSAEWLHWREPIGGKLDTPVVLETSFSVLPERITMNDVALTIGQDDARGALEVNLEGAVPMTSGSLAFQSLDLNAFKAAIFRRVQDSGSVDLSLLNHLGIDIRLSSPEAKINNINLSNLAASIQIRQGRGVFDLGNAGAFSGTLQANIQISQENNNGFIDGRFSGSQLDLGRVARVLNLTPYLDGKGDFTFTLKAPFVHWNDIPANISGNLSLTSQKSRLVGYAFNNVFEKLKTTPRLELTYNPTENLVFDSLNFNAEIKDGVALPQNSTIRLGREQITFNGFMPFASSNDPTIVRRDVALNLAYGAIDRSDTVCPEVQCLINSLVNPLQLFVWQDSENKTLHIIAGNKGDESLPQIDKSNTEIDVKAGDYQNK